VVHLAVVTAIMPGAMLYAAPVWGGVYVGAGATERDMDRLSSVWDGRCASISLWACEIRHEGAVSIGSRVAVVSVGSSERGVLLSITHEWCFVPSVT
jgi:hypothetical protein